MLSACGGGDDSSTAAAAASGQPDTEAMAAFQSCMEENGASVPGPAAGGAPPTGTPPASSDSGSSDSTGSDSGSGSTAQPPQMPEMDADTQAALEACSDLMPTPPDGAPTGAPPTGTAP